MKPGLASLTGEAVHECGAGKYGAQELQEAFEELGATLSVSTGLDGTTFSFTVVSSRLEGALGWRPTISWREGVRDLARWLADERHPADVEPRRATA